MKTAYDILQYPISTEKAVREMEANNCLIFIVTAKATKQDVKKATEKAFNVKVIGVRTVNTMNGLKKAYIKLHKDTPAADVTTKLGMV